MAGLSLSNSVADTVLQSGSMLKRVKRLKRKFFPASSPFVEAQTSTSESESTKKCVKITVQPPGRDGFEDTRKLWALKDTGSSANLMRKSVCDNIYGVDNFHWYHPKAMELSGLGGNEVLSLGRRHIYLSFKGKKDVYTAEVEIFEEAQNGKDPDNFDILLCEKFFKDYQLVKWSEKISGKVNYLMHSRRYSPSHQVLLADVKDKIPTNDF